MRRTVHGRRRGSLGKTLFVLLILTLVVGIGVLFTVPAIVLGPMVNLHVDFSRMYSATEYGLEEKVLQLKTTDGLRLTAYEVEVDAPKAVLIFLSGIHNPSVTAFYPHAAWLKEEGYASLLLEMRAHGLSEGSLIGLGLTEHKDVQAAVDYIRETPRYQKAPIVVFGLSMGGATAINAIGQIPEIQGLISLSAFSSVADMFAGNMEEMGMPSLYIQIQKPFARFYTTLKYGISTYALQPKTQIANLRQRPALLIHSTKDSQVSYQNFLFLKDQAPSHVETWVKEGDYHFILDPSDFQRPSEDLEYAARIIGFLTKHFPGGE